MVSTIERSAESPVIGQWVMDDSTSSKSLDKIAGAIRNRYSDEGVEVSVDRRTRSILFHGDLYKGLIKSKALANRFAARHGGTISEATYLGDQAEIERGVDPQIDELLDDAIKYEEKIKKLEETISEQETKLEEKDRTIRSKTTELSRARSAPTPSRTRKPTSVENALLSYISSQSTPIKRAVEPLGENLEEISQEEILKLTPAIFKVQSVDEIGTHWRAYVTRPNADLQLQQDYPNNSLQSRRNIQTRLDKAGKLWDQRGKISVTANQIKKTEHGAELPILLQSSRENGHYSVTLTLPGKRDSAVSNMLLKDVKVEGSEPTIDSSRSYTQIEYQFDRRSTTPNHVRQIVDTIEYILRENYDNSLLVEGRANIPLKLTVLSQIKADPKELEEKVETTQYQSGSASFLRRAFNEWTPTYNQETLDRRVRSRILVNEVSQEPLSKTELVEALVDIYERSTLTRQIEFLVRDGVFSKDQNEILTVNFDAVGEKKVAYISEESEKILERNEGYQFTAQDIVRLIEPGSSFDLSIEDINEQVRENLQKTFGDRLLTERTGKNTLYALI